MGNAHGHQLHRSLKISTVCPLIASLSRASQQVVQQNGFAESSIAHVSQFCPNNRFFHLFKTLFLNILKDHLGIDELHNSVQIITFFICSKRAKISLELVVVACVCSCLCDPVQNWKWSKGNIQAFLVFEFSAYLAIIWNNWKRKYLKQPQNVWHWLLAKVQLDSNETWPDWEKKQTPMQQSRRRKVHQGNTQARDNPDLEIFVAYIK